MSRSSWKPIYLKQEFYNNFESANHQNDGDNFLVFDRATPIIFEMIGYTFFVYNGNRFFKVLVDSDKVGHLFGEFAVTRKKHIGKLLRK